MAGSCEYGIELSVSIKELRFLDQQTGNYVICGVNKPVSYLVSWLVILHLHLEEERPSKMSVKSYQTTQRHILEDNSPYSPLGEL